MSTPSSMRGSPEAQRQVKAHRTASDSGPSGTAPSRAARAPRPPGSTSNTLADLARQLLFAPNLVTLVRLPLAVLFPIVAGSPLAAIAVLGLAGTSDVLDGWLARRSRHATVLGQILDPIADKVFVASVLLTLVLRHTLPLWSIPILLARELMLLPMTALVLASRRRRRAVRIGRVRANRMGKLDTVVLFATLAAAIAFPSALDPMLALAGAAGVAAAISYAAREIASPEERARTR